MTTIVLAAGLCSAIRPKLLTALPPEKYPNIRITAWGEGHWHQECSETQVFPDDDPWVRKHIAHVDVSGAPSFVKWVEYVCCRVMGAEPSGNIYLMSKPLEPRNIAWAAKWDTLPDGLRQNGCQHRIPKQNGKAPQRQRRPQRTKRKQAGGILDTLARLFR